jgi:hypothetical protein
MELAAICKERQFNLESLTTNSTLKQSKSIEISKGLVLILKTYCVYEKERARRISSIFEKKKKGEELTKGGIRPSSSGPLSLIVTTRHPLPSGGTTTGGAAGLGPPLPSVGQ